MAWKWEQNSSWPIVCRLVVTQYQNLRIPNMNRKASGHLLALLCECFGVLLVYATCATIQMESSMTRADRIERLKQWKMNWFSVSDAEGNEFRERKIATHSMLLNSMTMICCDLKNVIICSQPWPASKRHRPELCDLFPTHFSLETSL